MQAYGAHHVRAFFSHLLILVVAGLSCPDIRAVRGSGYAGRISPSLPLVIIRRWPHGICRDTCDLRRTYIQQPWDVDYVRHPTKYRIPAVIQNTKNLECMYGGVAQIASYMYKVPVACPC
ncbi:hypothetical protein HDV62DRAFT_94984 [Trichoderma sp. SZMC 28011]